MYEKEHHTSRFSISLFIHAAALRNIRDINSLSFLMLTTY